MKFNNENDGKWYIDFPNWPFNHHNLMMVAGADRLCTILAGNKKVLDVFICTDIYNTDYTKWEISMKKYSSTIFGGAYYHSKDKNNNYLAEVWLCPVTLCVFGKYPDYVLIKHAD